MSDTDTFQQTIAGVTEQWAWHDEDQHADRMAEAILRRADIIYGMQTVARLAADEPLFPIPNITSWAHGAVEDKRISLFCSSAAEMRAVVRVLGDGDKVEDDDYGQAILFRAEGLHWRAVRTDLVCEMEPVLDDDGNEVMEEITVRETIAPEKVREVVKLVPKTKKSCPPILG